MAEYESLPLSADIPSFRLLELDLDHDAENGDQAAIHATMANYDCDNAPEYEALLLHLGLTSRRFSKDKTQ